MARTIYIVEGYFTINTELPEETYHCEITMKRPSVIWPFLLNIIRRHQKYLSRTYRWQTPSVRRFMTWKEERRGTGPSSLSPYRNGAYVPPSFRCNPHNGGRFFAGGRGQSGFLPAVRTVGLRGRGSLRTLRAERATRNKTISPPPFPYSPIRPDPPTAERSPDCPSVPPPSIRTALPPPFRRRL